MRGPEAGTRRPGERESSVLSAFNRIESVFNSMKLPEGRAVTADWPWRRSSFADGNRFQVTKYDKYKYADLITSLKNGKVDYDCYEVEIYNSNEPTLAFALGPKGLESLYISPVFEVVVGNSRSTAYSQVPLKIDTYDVEMPQNEKQKFRELASPLVDWFDKNFSAKSSEQMTPPPIALAPSAKYPRRWK